MNRLLLLAVLAWPALVAAQTPAAAPAPMDMKALEERGQQLASQVCAACHGGDGNSPTPANPSLAGQHADYITLQLAHFKAGIRQNPIMQGIAAGLSDSDMRAAGLFYARQQARGLAAKDPALVKLGNALWRGGDKGNGVPACAGCHSPNGAGVPKNYPRIAGQYADYTYTQLKAFKSGERGRDKEGKDANGRVMRGVVKGLTDTQMRAVSDFAAGLR
jgi:cytochrome c553